MGRKRRTATTQVVGLVCYADGDPLAELAIVTEFDQEYPLEPVGPMSDAAEWIDGVVQAWGQLVWIDGRRYLRVERVRELPGEHEIDPEAGYFDESPGADFGWRDDDDGYESFS